MSRNDSHRRGGKNRSGWNNNRTNNNPSGHSSSDKNRKLGDLHRQAITAQQQKEIADTENAIREFKSNILTCEMCGEAINELSSAVNSRETGKPVHFDCVLNRIIDSEKPGINEKVTYIGNGKFAVLHFDNVHDMRHFTIKKTIEWESRESERGEWRNEMAGLYSQVK